MDEASFAGVAERLRWWMGIVVVASLSVEGDLMGAGFEMDFTKENGGCYNGKRRLRFRKSEESVRPRYPTN